MTNLRATIKFLWFGLPTGLRHRLWQFIIWLDQGLAVLVGGWADETPSSYAWRLERDGKFWGRYTRPAIDWVFLHVAGQENHCEKCYMSERLRGELPPELRRLGTRHESVKGSSNVDTG